MKTICRMVPFFLILVMAIWWRDTIGVGSPVTAQPAGPMGLTRVIADGDTVAGTGRSGDPLRINAIYSDTSFGGTGSAGAPLYGTPIGASQHIFGNCSDGNLTASSGTTTITRDMFYENVTLSGTAEINGNGFRIFVCDTLTMEGTSRIRNNGGNGGAVSSTDGGAYGSYAPANSIGRAGANGGTGGNAAGSTASNGPSSSGLIESGCNTASISAGANGGLCQGGGGGAGGAGSGGSVASSNLDVNINGRLADFEIAVLGTRARGGSERKQGAGASGGAGGRGAGTGASLAAGGGGGGTGGWLMVLARTIVATSCHANGCLQARGGDGSAGGSGGNTGGGGGGGGGTLILAYAVGAQPEVSVAGGAGGAGNGTGTAGGNGGTGLAYIFKVGRQ